MRSKKSKITLNGIIFLLVGGFIWYVVSSIKNNELSYTESDFSDSSFVSPYKQVASFSMPKKISRFKNHNKQLLVATQNSIYIYDIKGNLISSFPIKPGIRDITTIGDSIYLLYPASVYVHTLYGEKIQNWEACSKLSDYCSLTVSGNFIYITDATNKNICQYTRDGYFIKFIHSPVGFIVPSYSFDIKSRNDTIYCTNPGKHLIESYTSDGKFIAAFGSPGNKPGSFVGCCNPSFITLDTNGDIITSEKGNPRICRFDKNGNFKQVLLNSRLLGGGSEAYEIQIQDRYLLVVGKDKIIVFEPVRE